MAIPEQILIKLEQNNHVVAPMTASLDDHVAWVEVYRFRYGPPERQPTAKFRIRWIEMSQAKIKAYARGGDICVDSESTSLEVAFAGDEDELEELLRERMDDLGYFMTRQECKYYYPT